MDERIRLPNISAGSVEGRLEQIKNYLHQLALQLDRILENGGSGGVVAQTEDAQTLFSRLMPLILQSKEITENLKQKLEGSFADTEDIEDYVGKWLQPEFGGGVRLGITENKEFIPIVSYRPDMVVLYQNGEEAMRFEGDSLSIERNVWAQSLNGVYMRSAMPGTDGKLRIQTKFEEFGQAGDKQCFFIFGHEGGMPFSDIMSVSGDGEIECGYFAFAEAGEFGKVVISDNLDICVILSPEFFQIV